MKNILQIKITKHQGDYPYTDENWELYLLYDEGKIGLSTKRNNYNTLEDALKALDYMIDDYNSSDIYYLTDIEEANTVLVGSYVMDDAGFYYEIVSVVKLNDSDNWVVLYRNHPDDKENKLYAEKYKNFFGASSTFNIVRSVLT